MTQEDIVELREERWFFIAGTFFLIAQVIILSALAFDPSTRVFLVWSCNNFCFFLALACYFQNMQLVKGLSYVGLVTQLLWTADFLSPYFGFNVSSISDYATIGGFTYINTISIVLHMLIPLIVLAFSFRIRPEPRSIIYSLPYVLFLFYITLTFTSPEQGINCVYAACHLNILGSFDIPYAYWLWPIFAMIPAFLGYAIHQVLYYGWNDILKGKIHLKI